MQKCLWHFLYTSRAWFHDTSPDKYQDAEICTLIHELMHCLCIKTSHGQKNPRICKRVCPISGEGWLMRYWFIRNAFTRRMQTRWDMTRRFNCHKSDFYLLQVLWIKYFIVSFFLHERNPNIWSKRHVWPQDSSVTKTEVLWDPIRVVFSLFDENFNF